MLSVSELPTLFTRNLCCGRDLDNFWWHTSQKQHGGASDAKTVTENAVLVQTSMQRPMNRCLITGMCSQEPLAVV